MPSELLVKVFIWYHQDDIQNIIIKNFNSSGQAHGYDKISIRMLKIDLLLICKSLKIIFKSCLESGTFPLE